MPVLASHAAFEYVALLAGLVMHCDLVVLSRETGLLRSKLFTTALLSRNLDGLFPPRSIALFGCALPRRPSIVDWSAAKSSCSILYGDSVTTKVHTVFVDAVQNCIRRFCQKSRYNFYRAAWNASAGHLSVRVSVCQTRDL